MNGIIADLLFGFVPSRDEEHEGLYEARPLGLFADTLSRLGDRNVSFVMMTKLGCDSEAEALRTYYDDSGSSMIEYYESSTYPTALSIDGEKRLRYSALSDIKAGDVMDFIDRCDIDTLFISAALLSFKPVSREIVTAVIERRDKLERVVVDATLDWDILLLEEVKECMETMMHPCLPVSLVGEALTIVGVGGMSAMKRDEILTHLPE